MIFRLLFSIALLLAPAASLRAAGPCPTTVCPAPDSCGGIISECLENSEVLCCPECNCACDPCCGSWYVQADGLIITRNNGSTDRPVVVTDNTGATVLTTHDLDFDFQGAPRILLGLRTASDRAWELSYFGTRFWDASATATDPNNLDLPGPIVAVANDFDNADQMRLTYRSQLHNAELNLVDDRDGWSLLGGFRYLNLDERFNIRAQDSDGDVSDYTTRTTNNLFGGQLGARVQRWTSDRFSWDLVGKAGIYGNAAAQHSLLRDNDNTVVLFDTTARRGAVSFIGDVNLAGAYALNDVWSVRAGYYVMWVAGLALAPDQLDFSNDADTGTRITTGGDLFVHGATVGLEARW